mmetsp:Transcript_4056/g.11552  ORF Transcript_4056/g.11552 Transcript_4056/m.11552 type:complete len:530 (+) Transcript_4056:124-1713(+)
MSTAPVDGDRTAEFGHFCEATTLGIAPEELLHHRRNQVRRHKRRKVAPAPAPAGDGADRRPLLAGGKDADGNAVPPVALNFLGDLTATSNSNTSTAAAARQNSERKDTAVAADEAAADDPWMANAHRLEASMAQMSHVLRRQEAQYVDLYGCLRNVLGGGNDDEGDAAAMTDAERNALDAAVASFAVSTGNQIEALRQALASAAEGTPQSSLGRRGGTSTGSDLAAHRVGIVACLVSALRADVVDRMGRMHAVRMRRSLDLARDPLQCRLPTTGGVDGAGGSGGEGAFMADDDDDDATARLESLLGNIRAAAASEATAARAQEEDFCATYGQEGEARLLKEVAMPLPPFPRADDVDMDPDEQDGFEQEHFNSGPSSSSRPQNSHSKMKNASSARPRHQREELGVVSIDPSVQQYYGESTAEQEAYIEDLQRESAYLTASLQNELEDVHKIENKMMEITTLLRQFGDMVAEQQEDIVAIHEQAEKSKKNVQAGQDNLVDAGERKKKSKHYMATFIASMGVLLLFLNWITP